MAIFHHQTLGFSLHLTSHINPPANLGGSFLQYPEPEHFSSSSLHHFLDSYNSHPTADPAVTCALAVSSPHGTLTIPVQPKCDQGAPPPILSNRHVFPGQSLQGPTDSHLCTSLTPSALPRSSPCCALHVPLLPQGLW